MDRDESILIDRTIRGDREAFGELVRAYQDRLYNMVYRILGHAEDSRDVVQESLISAYRNLGSFKRDSAFYTWLYRIAVNSAITLRRKQRKRAVLQTPMQGSGVEPVDNRESGQPSLGLEREDNEAQLQRALAQLTADFRTVIVLRDLQDLTYEEIAEVLEIPLGTVRSRINRARLALRELLQHNDS